MPFENILPTRIFTTSARGALWKYIGALWKYITLRASLQLVHVVPFESILPALISTTSARGVLWKYITRAHLYN